MFNFLEKIKENPAYYKQLSIDEQLVTEYDCPLENPKEDIWTNQDYFAYVIEGVKYWHIPGKTFKLSQGECIFVKKGAHIVEQSFDSRFCTVVFFVSDHFIIETLHNSRLLKSDLSRSIDYPPVNYIDADDSLHAFFNSVVPYFLQGQEVNKALLELKFRELILNVVNNPRNKTTTEYFYSLFSTSDSETIRLVMEENFCYNLRLEEYARLCGQSLSAFKRGFQEYFKTTPGRWLLERRLNHAQLLLNSTNKTISEIAFECGFENISHFSRVYKKQFGNSPTTARNLVS